LLPSRFTSIFVALRHRDFRLLWAGTFCSAGGQWIQAATLGWVVYDVTKSGTLLGAVLAMRAIPLLVLAPLTGVVAERHDRRRVLAASQFIVVAISLALAAGLALHQVRTWHLFAFTFCVGISIGFDRTLRNALVFGVVPRSAVPNALALNSIAFSVMRTAGPALAGVLIATMGAALNFTLQALLYVGVMVIALAMRTPHEAPRRTTDASAWAEMKSGTRFVARDPVARMMVLLALVQSVLLIPSFTLMPVFAVRVYGVGPEGLGLLLSAVGAGGVLGGAAAVWIARFDRVGLTQSLGLAVFAFALFGFALSPGIGAASFFLMIAGMCEMVITTGNSTALQMCAPLDMRGRIASLLPMFMAAIGGGSFLYGWCSDYLGAPATVMIFALVAVGITAAAWIFSSPLRRLRLSQYIVRD
jgi:MFS family permease